MKHEKKVRDHLPATWRWRCRLLPSLSSVRLGWSIFLLNTDKRVPTLNSRSMHPLSSLLLFRSAAPPSALPLRRRRRSPTPVRATWQELAGVLVFSAIPFTAVKALANSPLGARLRRRLEDRKAAAAAEADALRAASRGARNNRCSPFYCFIKRGTRRLICLSCIRVATIAAFGTVEIGHGGLVPCLTTTLSI
jgi:hypothetical protein